MLAKPSLVKSCLRYSLTVRLWATLIMNQKVVLQHRLTRLILTTRCLNISWERSACSSSDRSKVCRSLNGWSRCRRLNLNLGRRPLTLRFSIWTMSAMWTRAAIRISWNRRLIRLSLTRRNLAISWTCAGTFSRSLPQAIRWTSSVICMVVATAKRSWRRTSLPRVMVVFLQATISLIMTILIAACIYLAIAWWLFRVIRFRRLLKTETRLPLTCRIRILMKFVMIPRPSTRWIAWVARRTVSLSVSCVTNVPVLNSSRLALTRDWFRSCRSARTLVLTLTSKRLFPTISTLWMKRR